MSINLDLSPNSSSTNFSLKNISKEIQNNPNNNKNEPNLRNNIILPLGNNNISKSFNMKDSKENKHFNKLINSNLEITDPNQDYDVNSGNKNRLIYEKIKQKLNFNNNNSNSIYNNYINMQLTKSNSNKNLNNENKSSISSNASNNIKNNLNVSNNCNSMENRKKNKNFVRRNNYNYYERYVLNNNRNKGLTNRNSNNSDISKNKKDTVIDNNKNTNFNRFIIIENTYRNIYKSKKDGIKPNINNQFSNSLSITPLSKNYNNQSMSDRTKENSISTKNGFTKLNINSLDNIMVSYSQIQEKKKKVLNLFKNNKKITSKEEAFYILSVSPMLNLSEQIIFSRATENLKKVISIDNILNNNYIFLNIKAKTLINELTIYEKKINKPFTASKTADITLNFITSLDEKEFKDFDILETNKGLVNIYYYYIKLFCILFNINYNHDLKDKKIKTYLYEKIKEKGFNHLKDYLYYIYIAKKENIKIFSKIDIINNEIFSKIPNMLNIQESIKLCRFTAFSNYLLKEIVNYGNNLKNLFELKFRAQYLLEFVLGKIDKIQNHKKQLKK